MGVGQFPPPRSKCQCSWPDSCSFGLLGDNKQCIAYVLEETFLMLSFAHFLKF